MRCWPGCRGGGGAPRGGTAGIPVAYHVLLGRRGAEVRPTAPAPLAYDNRASPIDLLASFYNAVNRQEYARAYGYWETPPSSYDQFAAGYANTAAVQLIAQP